MGCLNAGSGFSYWFGNIHLSGPCNRSCYFCIGQHMMALDSFNTLDRWPLGGWPAFVARCTARRVAAVYLTGTNTDPLLYRHHEELTAAVRGEIGAPVGIRTNGVSGLRTLSLYDAGSVTVCSLDPGVYRAMMGSGKPPDLSAIIAATAHFDPTLKVNIVLGPENVGGGDLWETLGAMERAGIKRVNLREPYGQPHVGDPCPGVLAAAGDRLGMPVYSLGSMEVLYWDVHYVAVESVNLYANGRVSETYPITKGHAETGIVLDQSHFPGGRVREQWVEVSRA